MYTKSMTRTQQPTNLYYFSNGTHIEARNMVEAFAEFRRRHGATAAVLDTVRSMADVWAEAHARSMSHND